MVLTDEQNGFSFPVDWAKYIEYRPKYTPQFYDRIHAYHEQHSNQWKLAHDVGSGAGIVAEVLAERFEHVVVSDPSQDFVTTAEMRLQSSMNKDKFEFRVESAETMDWTGEGSIDLVTIATAIHWTDWDVTVKKAARALRSGGTFACWMYSRPWFVDNEAAQKAWSRIFEIYQAHLMEENPMVKKRARPATDSALDCVAMPQELYEKGALRERINFQGRKYGMAFSQENPMPGESQVGENDIVEEVVEKSLNMWVDSTWFQEYINTLSENGSKAAEQALWDDLATAMGGKGEKAEIEWPTILLLASKR